MTEWVERMLGSDPQHHEKAEHDSAQLSVPQLKGDRRIPEFAVQPVEAVRDI